MIIDTGQSGHPGTAHWSDQTERWSAGEPAQIPLTAAEIAKVTTGRILLVPRR